MTETTRSAVLDVIDKGTTTGDASGTTAVRPRRLPFGVVLGRRPSWITSQTAAFAQWR